MSYIIEVTLRGGGLATLVSVTGAMGVDVGVSVGAVVGVGGPKVVVGGTEVADGVGDTDADAAQLEQKTTRITIVTIEVLIFLSQIAGVSPKDANC